MMGLACTRNDDRGPAGRTTTGALAGLRWRVRHDDAHSRKRIAYRDYGWGRKDR